MVKIICVLRSGGDFTPRHVQVLAGQVPGLVCLSDTAVPGVETIQLKHDCPGWWSKLELCRPDIEGDLLYLDLDTVVPGDFAPLIEAANGKTTMLSDFYWPEHPASGFMYIAEKDKSIVWDRWITNPKAHMTRPATRGRIGDQAFFADCWTPQRWQDIAPGKVVSYKVHCKQGLPEDAAVVCFHGKPRPQDVKADWVPDYGN